jgi:O-antigen ligase
MLARDRLVLRETGRVFLVFWSVAFVLMLAGWLHALTRQIAAPSAIHDFVAYVLVGIFTLVLCLKDGAPEQVRAAGPAVLWVTIVPLFIVLLLMLMGISYWGWAGRFTGWSMNPNQVALAMAPAPFLALYSLQRRGRAAERLGYGLLLVGSTAVGIGSLSDGMFLGWAAGAVVLIATAWIRAFRRGRAPFVRAAVIYIIAPLVVIGLMAVLGSTVFLAAQDLGNEVYYGQNNQGSVRVTVWRSGIEAVGRSPVFGWGPGAHTSLTPGPIHESEAHNGLIDWSTATGLIGTFLFIGLHSWVAWKARAQPALLAALLALVVLGFTHHFLRHPLYWFYLLFVVAAGEHERTVSFVDASDRHIR